jgi:hypothetical protein
MSSCHQKVTCSCHGIGWKIVHFGIYQYSLALFLERIDTRRELYQNENIAMVTYGHMTEVRHHLTNDYDIVLRHLGMYLDCNREMLQH